MKKMIFVAAALTIAVVMMNAVASAQGPGRGGAGGGAGFGGFGVNLAAVLRNADCRALLAISDEQTQKITQINQESRAANQERGTGQPDRADMERRRQETQDKLKAVLSADQLAKAKVLLFQVSGGLDAGASTVETLDALGLSDDQKEKIRAINAERAARGAGGGQVDADQRRARAAETRDKIKAVLTDDQKAKAAKLTEEGKEIREKFQAAQQRPGQGQGQRQGGQGRGNRSGGN